MNENEKTSTAGEEKRHKIRSTVVTVVVSVFFAFIIFVYYSMLSAEKKNTIILNGRVTAEDSADQIDQYLDTNIDSLKLAAYALDEMLREHRTDAEIQDYLVSQSTAIRTAVSENSTGLYGYINGRFFSGTNWQPPEGYDATARPWYTKPMQHPGQLTILEPYTDVQSGNTMLALGKTLCDNVSVLSVDVSLDQIQKLTEKAVRSGNADVEMILDDNEIVIAHSDPKEVGKDYQEESGTLGEEIVKRLSASDDDTFEFTFRNAHYLMYVVDMENGWHCISVKDATTIFRNLQMMLLVTIIVVVALVLVIGLIRARSARYQHMSIKARAESEAKSTFLSNMSHEIRTPINAMMNMNEMILRESEDPAILTYAGNVKNAGNNLLTLVNDILAFSKSEERNRQSAPADYEKFYQEHHTPQKAYRVAFTAPKARILLVDDHSMNLMVFQNLIKQTEVVIDTAESGDDGIRLTCEQKYDILFLDHMMPGKDGVETLHEIREDEDNPNRETPAVCLSANAISGARESYLSEGFEDYLSKPLDPEKLEETMIALLPPEKVEMRPVMEEETDAGEDEALLQKLAALEESRIDTEAGLKNSGTAESYLALLKTFYESIDDMTELLNGFYEQGNFKNYTIKVHALKSSAKIIGAAAFGEEAQRLEDAGKAENLDYIRKEHAPFMEKFQSFKELLAPLFQKVEDTGNKPKADEALLGRMYAELYAGAQEMDCEKLEAVFDELDSYRIPEEETALYEKLKKAYALYKYDTIQKALDEAKKPHS